MKYGFSQWSCIASVLMLFTSLSYAQESKVSAVPAAPQSSSGVAHGSNGKAKAAATKVPAKSKLVDINNAGKDELKALPGISDALADKIIAGRPYGSKADLVSHGILLGGPYQTIRKSLSVGKPKNSGTLEIPKK
jgi:DNA uptake protein ComE-like DNA-binding protein